MNIEKFIKEQTENTSLDYIVGFQKGINKRKDLTEEQKDYAQEKLDKIYYSKEYVIFFDNIQYWRKNYNYKK